MARAYLTDTNIITDNAEPYATEPVTVAQLKLHMQLEGDAYNDALARMIKAARKKIEKYCNVSLVAKAIKVKFNTVGCPELKLPYPPQDVITTVGWQKCPSTWVALESDASSGYQYWEVDDEAFWKAIVCNQVGNIRITYTTKAIVDNDIYTQAILMQAGYMYTNRDEANPPEWSPQVQGMLKESRFLTY